MVEDGFEGGSGGSEGDEVDRPDILERRDATGASALESVLVGLSPDPEGRGWGFEGD